MFAKALDWLTGGPAREPVLVDPWDSLSKNQRSVVNDACSDLSKDIVAERAKNERLFASNVKLATEIASLKGELSIWKPSRDTKGRFVKKGEGK